MAHLLMIESWVGGTGRVLPSAITNCGHHYTFVTRNRRHYLDDRMSEIHPVLEHAAQVLTVETNDLPILIEFLRRQHESLRFDGVITVCDYYIETVVQVAEALRLPHGFPTAVSLERRKHLVRQALDHASLPNPAYAVTTTWGATRDAAERIGCPLIVKPTDLASSAFVRLVKDERELHDAFSSLQRFARNFRDQAREPIWLLEEFMTGEEVSIEACTYRGETTVLGITDKSVTGFPYFVEDGHMFPARLDPEIADRAVGFVREALQAVGHDHGLSHTEVKLTPNGPRIVEINPRPGGNYIAELVEHVTGVDMLGAQIDLSLGRRPDLSGRDTGVASAAIAFLIPPRAGRVVAVTGTDTLSADPHVRRWTVNPMAGTDVTAATDNACYQGHVVAIDRNGLNARHYAERALRRVRLTYEQTAPAVAL
jgi:biotin carboxylase